MHNYLMNFLKKVRNNLLLAAVFVSLSSCVEHTREVDVLIIGGGASGVAAGVQAARLGATSLIVEPTTWLGGMLTSAGVSAVDGNYRMPAGIFGEFRDKLAAHYGGLDALKTGWVSNVLFEPSVGNQMFRELADAEPNLTVEYETVPISVTQESDGTWKAEFKDNAGKTFDVHARILIDGTELGDIAKSVGVGYDLGMESRSVTGEDIAPDSARNIIQDITMVAILKDYGHEVEMAEPADYDPAEFACTCENELCTDPDHIGHNYTPAYMMEYGHLPNGKYMINWPVAGNDIYINLVEMTPEEREAALEVAKQQTLRYVYFLHDQLGFKNLALADDEFPTDDLLPFIPYHRESRRIHGLTRFTLNHITHPYSTPEPLYRTSIAVGDYPVDHHHKAYNGLDTLPKIGFYPIPSYGLPMGVLIPQDVDNMLVTEKSVSVSNIANGSTRLQPVVVQIGQAAGAIAAIAALDHISPADVDVRRVQQIILDGGGYIMPFLDVDKSDPKFKPYQRIGAVGILEGEGRNVGWSNQTWLRADDNLLLCELIDFYKYYLDEYDLEWDDRDPALPVTFKEAVDLISLAADGKVDVDSILTSYGMEIPAQTDVITRGTYALIVDSALDPFGTRPVDIHGKFKH